MNIVILIHVNRCHLHVAYARATESSHIFQSFIRQFRNVT